MSEAGQRTLCRNTVLLAFTLVLVLALQGCEKSLAEVEHSIACLPLCPDPKGNAGTQPLPLTPGWGLERDGSEKVADANVDDVATTVKFSPSFNTDDGNMADASVISSGSPTDSAVTAQCLPLGLHFWGGGPRLTVNVAPSGVDGSALPAQQMVLDTGSSTLAFCRKELLSEAAYSQTQYLSCNQYNPGGSATGYWGPFVQGTVQIGGTLSVSSGSYSVMQQEVGMPCSDGFQGIFGIAFKQLSIGFPIEEQPSWAPQSAGNCPSRAVADFATPLQQSLQTSGQPGKLGIYWSGQTGEDVGRLYLDAAATSNQHYVSDAVVGPALLGELGFYDIAVEKVTVGSMEWTGMTCDPRQSSTCIMDTGTPGIVVPKEVYEYAKQVVQFGNKASLTVWLSGAEGQGAVPVTFDVQSLMNSQALSANDGSDGFILGLPLWRYYYTVFDIPGRGVSLVPLQGALVPDTEPTQEPQPEPEVTTQMPQPEPEVTTQEPEPWLQAQPGMGPTPATGPLQIPDTIPWPSVPQPLPRPWTIIYEENLTEVYNASANAAESLSSSQKQMKQASEEGLASATGAGQPAGAQSGGRRMVAGFLLI